MAGRISYYGGIIKDSLILDLDAAKKDSYPGTGNIWYDISGNNNHFNLYNTPIFSTNKGGCLSFNGSTQYAKSINTLNLSIYDYVLVESIFQISSISSLTMVYEHTSNWNANYGGFGLVPHSNGFVSVTNLHHTNYNTLANGQLVRNYSASIDTNWTNHVNLYSKISDTTGRLTYVTGSLTSFTGGQGTSTGGGGTFANDYFHIASRGGSSLFYTGSIGSIKIYGIKLSADNVLQNYNAIKSRFGI